MTADSFFTQAEHLGGFLQRLANRSLPQYRLLPWGRARICTNASDVCANQPF